MKLKLTLIYMIFFVVKLQQIIVILQVLVKVPLQFFICTSDITLILKLLLIKFN